MSAEEEPFLPLRWGDREIRMTSKNSQLYTFLGKTTILIGNDKFEIDRSAADHVWVATKKDAGIYFWKEHDPDEYQTMAGFIIEHSFPAYLNAREIAAHDLNAWLIEIDKEVETFVTTIPDGI